MSKSNAFEDDFLELTFNGTAIANLADNAASAPSTNLSIALHTSDPGEAGNQTTNEVTTGEYTGYTRINVPRTAGGWQISSGSASPAADIDFPQSTGGTGATITHFSVGTGVSDNMLYSGTVTPNITVVATIEPTLTTATTITED